MNRLPYRHAALFLAKPVRVWALFLLLMMPWPALQAADGFLDPEAAFRFSARMIDAHTVEVNYRIADGYYMYKERFNFRAEGATLGTPLFPPGKIKFDDIFQKNVETYHESVNIRLRVEAGSDFTLVSSGQGCAEKGLCYPPMESRIVLHPFAMSPTTPPAAETVHAKEETNRFETAISGGSVLAVIPLFFLGGLALSLTPCVLPMVPILSSIIVGEGSSVTRRRGFTLSLAYASGMALVYTVLGAAAGWIGEGLAASFQNPWVLGSFGLLIAALALSMFDVYQLQMPAAIQMRLMKASDSQQAGKLAGVFAMGALSGLIVGPCVAAPLLGALVFISKTHNLVLGGCALFSTAAGMSVPLLLVGLSAGWLLPRAGVWMEAIKRFFGVLLLGVALWMVTPIIPANVQMLGWFILCVGYGTYLIFNKRWGITAKIAGSLFALLGVAELAGVATGGRDALAPLAHIGAAQEPSVRFARVQSLSQLEYLLGRQPGKTAMLDFYADWCIACKEMEKFTFSDPHVRQKMGNMIVLQADVTSNNAEDKALLKHFSLYGPPCIIFFDKNGREIRNARVVGFQDANEFLGSLARTQSGS